MTKWLNSLQPYGALLMRLALGISMAVHGYGKVVPHGALNHHAHYIVSLGLPYWLGYVSAYTEFVGGLMLIVGLLIKQMIWGVEASAQFVPGQHARIAQRFCIT